MVIGTLLLLDLLVDYSYHRDLTITGGGSTFSDAIYTLSGYLESERGSPEVVAMDWGFKRPIQFLTQERVNPIEAYGYDEPPQPGFYSALRELIARPNTLYLFHTRNGTAYPRLDPFLSEVAAAGKKAVLEKTFYHRDGAPVYEVYSVK